MCKWGPKRHLCPPNVAASYMATTNISRKMAHLSIQVQTYWRTKTKEPPSKKNQHLAAV